LPPTTTRTTRCTICTPSASSSRSWSRDGDGRRRSDQDVPAARIKDSPPYLHDGRLLTLDDTVEFFNLVLETKLTDAEKRTWWHSCAAL